jgi:AcrR family transcriptional regulator
MTARSARRRRLARPKQARSHDTHERLLKATEDLLAAHEFNAITVEQIAALAHVSVSTFYKHFEAKRELLPLLVDRLYADAGSFAFPGEPARLAARVTFLAQHVASTATLRRNVLRACVTARFAKELVMSRSQLAQSRQQLSSAQAWLLECRDEIRHEDPVVATRIGLYSALQSLQTALLFEDLPAELPIGTLVSETARLLTRYLTGAGEAPQD